MSHVVSSASFEDVAVPASDIAAQPVRSCCQQAVDDAMENAASMGAIATVTMLVVGFTVGIATAWLFHG